MQTAGNLVAAAAELAACVQNRENNRNGGDSEFFVDADDLLGGLCELLVSRGVPLERRLPQLCLTFIVGMSKSPGWQAR